ncbi:hypothetical protein PoB_001224000 [Plakobranchus ocellatus]|uniref:Uncharacterized protein n=1 Tax=Plakobranchus ocellatus TaxID=259542 RepID=A0AAV3YTH0_9GAST|nr:hypothetical protein PoB_001224000 [Plakobranchus ocellatus]
MRQSNLRQRSVSTTTPWTREMSLNCLYWSKGYPYFSNHSQDKYGRRLMLIPIVFYSSLSIELTMPYNMYIMLDSDRDSGEKRILALLFSSHAHLELD